MAALPRFSHPPLQRSRHALSPVPPMPGAPIVGDARRALETQSGNKISTLENRKALAAPKKRITRKKS